ncbi:hypothetical protein FHT40_003017 [Mycolicibacterium sp. BK556]|uniref:hypothetical protein n=1 Tax=Mycobacteriaceae TaxID=1762 RepID=UPI001061757B|nr:MULTISPECIES: hypothetical protein [Mycobacteriaceae]MBB3603356.1 hypothetical protein [Mycolicibacterium sp. BK556]MBB3633551.1 hypothetical protein [Mycolicibacterium sp. BK607]TDO11670.1 hypothetical protein EV580_3388 [Mycobacterium sp. BK086]
MNWLVTVRDDANLQEISQRLRALGCTTVDTKGAVPMSDHELSIAVVGPSELPKSVQGDPQILGVWENSDIVLA